MLNIYQKAARVKTHGKLYAAFESDCIILEPGREAYDPSEGRIIFYGDSTGCTPETHEVTQSYFPGVLVSSNEVGSPGLEWTTRRARFQEEVDD